MKMDRKLISREKHEVAYCRRLARDVWAQEVVDNSHKSKKIIRVAKALLKFTKGYTKWKK